MKQLFDFSAVILIAICIISGVVISFTSKKIDSPAEQMIEAVLASEGIDVDFSEWKKEEAENE